MVQLFAMQHITPHYINSYWGTEHGGMVLSCSYGNVDQPLKPDTTMYNYPWIAFQAWISTDDEESGSAHRQVTGQDDPGEAVITAPWPYMARTTWGDASRIGHSSWMGDIERFKSTYFSRFKQPVFFQGDVAVSYPDGSFSLHGRSDDVLNVNGHRVGTGQIEASILRDKLRPDSPIGNCIIVGVEDEMTGQTPWAFLTLMPGSKFLSAD